MTDSASIPIARKEDTVNGTVTFFGPNFALDLRKGNPKRIHPDQTRDSTWHSALDDDPGGKGITTRLHTYGREHLLEIKLLIESGLEEIDKQEAQRE